MTYRHLTYTGVCRSYVRFVQKKQTYDLQTPVILVMNSVGVMSICEVLSRLKSLKDPNLDNLYNFFSNAKNGDIRVNCYCWGNSSILEGRFSKWF